MTTTTDDDDHEQLTQFRDAWKTWCETGDASDLVDLLAEDFVWMASWNEEPEIGKEEMVEHLEETPDAQYESERLIVRDDWAVEQVVSKVTTVDEETGESEQVTIGGWEVYQQKEDGDWKQILSLPCLPYRSIEEV